MLDTVLADEDTDWAPEVELGLAAFLDDRCDILKMAAGDHVREVQILQAQDQQEQLISFLIINNFVKFQQNKHIS